MDQETLSKMPTRGLQYADIISSMAEIHEIDVKLLIAILRVESDFTPTAVRYEEHYKYVVNADKYAKMNNITTETETILQKCSWGMGQVMGGKARECGFNGPLQNLCDPQIGVNFCAKILKAITKRYENREDQMAAYNAGSAIKKDDGTYVNQEYVNKVLKAYT